MKGGTEISVGVGVGVELKPPLFTSEEEALNEDRTRATSNSISDEEFDLRVNESEFFS